MAAPAGFGNWQQALDDILLSCKNSKAKLFLAFQKLKSNKDRIAFIFKHNLIRDIDWLNTYFEACRSWHGKSQVEAAYWKAKGNKFFQQKKFALAVDAYTQSCINAPVTEGNDLSLGIGNRSAALFHMSQYKMCITDIERAVDNGFPSYSLHKLLARKTMSFIKLSDKNGATQSLNDLKTFAESPAFGLTGTKKDEFLQEMERLNTLIQCMENLPDENFRDTVEQVPKLYTSSNDVISQASKCVNMAYTNEKGRHILANSDIPRGSTVIVERPFAAVLLPDHYETHCHHCFSSLPLNCIGCNRCTAVKFCNERCQDSGWSLYHKTECFYLDLLHSVGIAHLSLRVVLCAGSQFLQDFLEHHSHQRLSEEPSCLGLNKEGRYVRNYLTVFDLMTHEENTDNLDMLQYAMTAALLLVTLGDGGFFSTTEDCSGDHVGEMFDLSAAILNSKTDETTAGVHLPENMANIGGLLLRHILQLVCNAHAITSIQPTDSVDGDSDKESSVTGTEQTRIATAIYPTASLMNHSCDPTIISSFIGDTLVVRTVRDVSKGQEIFNCYGPHCCRMEREERQTLLEAQYHFQCQCKACEEGAVDHRRFGAYKCPRCAGVLSCSKCLECAITLDKLTQERLKSQAAQCKELFDNAVSLMNLQNHQAALTMFERCRDQRQEFLFKDHRDLALVHDAIARCYASQGDFCNAADQLRPSVDFTRNLYGAASPEYGHELHKLAEILFNAGRIRECVEVCKNCLQVLNDLYPPGQQVLREVKELYATAAHALKPLVQT